MAKNSYFNKFSGKSKVMEGRESAPLASLVGQHITITDVDTINTANGMSIVFTISGDDNHFFFASKPIHDTLSVVIADGMVDALRDETFEVIQGENKKGQVYTAIRVI